MGKKHKVALIVTAIVLVIIIAPLVGFLGYAKAWNAEMGLPEGFGSGKYPFAEGMRGTFDILREQYKEENTPELDNAIYFIYSNEKYSLQSNGRLREENQEYYVYKEISDTKIGSLKSDADSDDVYSWNDGGFLFFDNHYVYYMFRQTIKRWYFILSVHAPTEQDWLQYHKYTFHRFDLDTGSNEEVSINLYVEKANKYNETIKIK